MMHHRLLTPVRQKTQRNDKRVYHLRPFRWNRIAGERNGSRCQRGSADSEAAGEAHEKKPEERSRATSLTMYSWLCNKDG